MDINQLLQTLLPLVSGLSVLGFIMEPPKIINELKKRPIFQIAVLFLVMMQGGGKGDIMNSLMYALLFYFIVDNLKKMEEIEEIKTSNKQIREEDIIEEYVKPKPINNRKITIPTLEPFGYY
jgi:hypothetical protein